MEGEKGRQEMKYRVLSPNEIEAYNIGYKNGSRQCVIKVLEFESDDEKKFYRQGYNAGCQDRKRHNVSSREIESNVSNVSNVNSYDTAIAITNTITNTIQDTNSRDNILNNNTTRARKTPSLDEVLEYARQQNGCAGMGGFTCSDEEATEFYDYYTGIGWIVPNDAKTPIVDWKPFLRKWVRNPRFKKQVANDLSEESSCFKYEFSSFFDKKQGGTK